MGKTRNAFALRGYDAQKILQRPYFRKFREEYQIGDETDEEILKSLGADETDTIETLEKKLKGIKSASTSIISFHKIVHGHVKRLDRCNKRKTESQRGAQILEYFTASIDMLELENKLANAYSKLEREIQKRYKQDFTARLKKARKQAGLTQKQLGDLVEVSPLGFSRYERGERDIPIHTVIRLAKVLNLSGDQILGL